jgi:hypothetical protein
MKANTAAAIKIGGAYLKASANMVWKMMSASGNGIGQGQ